MEQPLRKCVKIWNTESSAHFYTFSCFKRRPLLTRERTQRYLTEAIETAREQHGFHLWAYVFMPEHVHLLVWFPQEHYSLSAAAKSIKQSVARRALTYLRAENPSGLKILETGQRKTPYRFWQQGPGFDKNLFDSRGIWTAMDYIHGNPVKRGLVANPEDWRWSSYNAWASGAIAPIRIDKDSITHLK